MVQRLFFSLILGFYSLAAYCQQIKIDDVDSNYQVHLGDFEQNYMSSPSEGLWSKFTLN